MGNCKKCPFYKTKPVPEDLAGKVNLTEWSSCDVDAVGFAAADRIGNGKTGYGWHISDLLIYDQPKGLDEFTRLRETKFGSEPVTIKRAPQSWFYVEAMKNE